jgi:starch synthase
VNRYEPTIALLNWSNLVEDFLDSIGVSLEAFCSDFTGSWMFGYAHALRLAGVRTVIIVISARVASPVRFTHTPTGATICILPAPKPYRAIQRRMLYPYGLTVAEVFGPLRGARRLMFPLFLLVKELSRYLTTPLRSLAHELRYQDCRAILCQEYENPRFDVCVRLGRSMRLPVFATFQGGDYQHGRLERFVRPLTMRSAAGLIIATRMEIQRVRSHYSVPCHKLAQIFNPVDLNIWSPADRNEARNALGIPTEARVAVWHGRVSINPKGLDVLVDAWERVCWEHPKQDLRLMLVGTGWDAAALRQRLATQRLRGVQWVDQFVHDRATLRRYLSAADVYAFASRHEGFPVALVEAMACGLPAVAADAQGVPDILKGGEASGGLIVPRDNAIQFARVLGRVLDDPSWARALGRRARCRVQTGFAPETVGGQLRHFLLNGGLLN